MARANVKPKTSKALQKASAEQTELLPHEFLRLVAQGDLEFEDYIILRGKKLKIKRKPNMGERLYAANASAPYFASKLLPKNDEGGSPEERAEKLREFYRAAAMSTKGVDE